MWTLPWSKLSWLWEPTSERGPRRQTRWKDSWEKTCKQPNSNWAMEESKASDWRHRHLGSAAFCPAATICREIVQAPPVVLDQPLLQPVLLPGPLHSMRWPAVVLQRVQARRYFAEPMRRPVPAPRLLFHAFLVCQPHSEFWGHGEAETTCLSASQRP